MGRRDECHEELGAVGIDSRVSHRQKIGLRMLQLEVFIVEFRPPNRLSTTAVSKCKITALGHEARDDSVERRACIAKWLSSFTNAGIS